MEINKDVFLTIKPNIVVDESLGQVNTSFRWGVLPQPNFYEYDGKKLLEFPKPTDSAQATNDLQLMRLFCCDIVRDLLNRRSMVDQDVVHEIDFKLDPKVTEFVCDVIQNLAISITDEIIYQNDPIKPIKHKLEKVLLNNKEDE